MATTSHQPKASSKPLSRYVLLRDFDQRIELVRAVCQLLADGAATDEALRVKVLSRLAILKGLERATDG